MGKLIPLNVLEQLARGAGPSSEQSFLGELDVLREAIASSISGVGLTDPTGRLLYVNNATVRMWRYGSAEEIVGRTLSDFWSGERVYETIQELMETGASVGEDIGLRKDGSTFPVQFSATMIRGDDGAPRFMFGSFVDLTEQARLKRRLARAHRLESLGQLISAAGHEINNPLTYVYSALQTIAEALPAWQQAVEELARDLPEGAELLSRYGATTELGLLAEDAADALRGARRIGKTIRDLTVFSTQDRVEEQPVSVNQAIDHAIRLVGKEIKLNAALVVDLAPLGDVLASYDRLVEVFVNLLLNARDALVNSIGSVREVRVRASRDGDTVAVAVEDTGSGMGPGELERVFDPFYSTQPTGGVRRGLGLWTTHVIVTDLGGEVEVESNLDEGSCVTVILPALEEGAVRVASPAEPVAVADPARPGHVLIVDDEPAVAKSIARALEGGFVTVVVGSAAEAQAYLTDGEGPVDAILCDLMMPEISGLDFYEWVVAERPALADRILFVSGGAFSAEIREFVASMPGRFLDKPIEASALRQALTDIIGRSATG